MSYVHSLSEEIGSGRGRPLLLKTGARLASLVRQTVLPSPFPGPRVYLQRLLVLCVFLPLLIALQLVHWIGFLLDEILFRGYRRIDIRQPVFILGTPRSGTTFMHRLVALHGGTTTFSTWECLLAPSISERYLWQAVAALDRLLGRPAGRLAGWIGRQLFAWLDDVHPLALSAPEEDYFALLPVLSCFLLVVPFPEADWLWRLARFDRDVDAEERRQLLGWYRRCLQKHLYFHGRDRVLVSKNASFAGMAASLVEAFPDARLIICERDALAVIRSQFRALRGGMKLFAIQENDSRFRSNLLDSLSFYYQNLDRIEAALDPGRVIRVPLWTLSEDPRSVLGRIGERFGLAGDERLTRALEDYEASKRPRREMPVRDGMLSPWGIDAAEVGQRFAAWRHDEGLRI